MDSSLTQGFIGPTVFGGRWGCHSHDVRAILIGHQGMEPSSKRAALGLSCRCPPGTVLFVGLCRSCFSCFCSDFQQWCWGDRSCTSSISVVRQHAARPVTFPRPPLVVASAVSAGNIVVVALGPPTVGGGTGGIPDVGGTYVGGIGRVSSSDVGC
jgi:hypothetical protein